MNSTDELLNAFDQTATGQITNPAEKLKGFIANVQAELDSDFPSLADDMAKIRKCILAAPELAHELTEDEQRSIFAGMQHISGMALVPEKPKKEKVAKVVGETPTPKARKAAAVEPEAIELPPPQENTSTKSVAQMKLAALLAKRRGS